jgi:ERCC4-type nuclease
MVSLIVDNRENIKELLEQKITNISFENLLIGDYCFKIDNEPFLIIERKTITDYAASIKDGRNREQKKRLLSQEVNKLYLVEGNLLKDNSSFRYNKVDKHTIISSIINTIIRDKINVFHTSDINETIFFIESIYRKLEKQGKTFIEHKSTYSQDLINTVNVSKKKNIDPNISFQMMMNCIPGISTKVSSRLSSRYKTLKDFIEILDKIETNEFRIKFIQDIRLENENKSRKISKNVAENIVNYLGYKLE